LREVDWLKRGEENITTKLKMMAGGMVQVVEHRPSKCETLSSNFSIVKKKNG
jgi:uncharacterized protein YfkK (UPF0435 family)